MVPGGFLKWPFKPFPKGVGIVAAFGNISLQKGFTWEVGGINGWGSPKGGVVPQGVENPLGGC